MNEESRKAYNAYMREWKRKNPDKVKVIIERYWAKKARKASEAAAPDENVPEPSTTV